MRFLYCVALIAVLALAGCPKAKPQLSTDTGVAIGGGGEITAKATTQVAMTCVGPENPEWYWEYKVPPEAEISSRFNGLPVRNLGKTVFGYDGTVYFTAWALPAAKEAATLLDESQSQDQNDTDLAMKRGSAAIQLSWLAKHAPKQAWLFAITPAGEFKWVFKAPGGPVGHPMLTADGNIMIGTYGIHAQNFHSTHTDADDPREHEGGIYVIKPNGELLRELDPGGWLDMIMLGQDDTLICRVSDEGDARIAEDLNDTLRMSPLQELPPYRYAAVNLAGEVLWEKPEGNFDVIGMEQDGQLLVKQDGGIFLVDPLSGENQGLFAATVQSGYFTEYDSTGAVYFEESGGDVFLELIEKRLTPAKANKHATLAKLDPDGSEVWRQTMGAAVVDMILRPDGELLLLRSWVEEDVKAPNGFTFNNYLLCYDSDGNWRWSYIDDNVGNMWRLILDDEQNVYSITSEPSWPKSRGIVSVDRTGKHRWSLPNEKVWGDSIVTPGPGGTLYVATNDSIIAYGEAEPGGE